MALTIWPAKQKDSDILYSFYLSKGNSMSGGVELTPIKLLHLQLRIGRATQLVLLSLSRIGVGLSGDCVARSPGITSPLTATERADWCDCPRPRDKCHPDRLGGGGGGGGVGIGRHAAPFGSVGPCHRKVASLDRVTATGDGSR